MKLGWTGGWLGMNSKILLQRKQTCHHNLWSPSSFSLLVYLRKVNCAENKTIEQFVLCFCLMDVPNKAGRLFWAQFKTAPFMTFCQNVLTWLRSSGTNLENLKYMMLWVEKNRLWLNHSKTKCLCVWSLPGFRHFPLLVLGWIALPQLKPLSFSSYMRSNW